MRFIGIDSGLLRTGWGVIDVDGARLSYVACGVIKAPPTLPMGARLAHIAFELNKVLETYKPGEAAVEETFSNQNPSSTLKLGMARGAALLTLASTGLDPQEYAPTTVKKAVCGRGHGGKEQVAHMVAILLPQAPRDVMADVTDALAVAICHAHHCGPIRQKAVG
jgi:crossover junction endodeoxyribonuclease RuvC